MPAKKKTPLADGAKLTHGREIVFETDGHNPQGISCTHTKKTKQLYTFQFGNAILQMKEVLGVTPREAQETLVEMGQSMIEKGLVAKKVKKTKVWSLQGSFCCCMTSQKETKNKKQQQTKKPIALGSNIRIALHLTLYLLPCCPNTGKTDKMQRNKDKPRCLETLTPFPFPGAKERGRRGGEGRREGG